jgi:nanoRNase/pAp phosphatase (c-di-AMP/oligoRNAs hydrolase)
MARRSAEPGSAGGGQGRPSDRFLAGLHAHRCVSFVSHVHPDPDSLGSMMGLSRLVEAKLNKPTRLTRDGLISRAENKAMVDLLDIELYPIDKATWAEGECLVMVDSQPNTGRHNLGPDAPPLYAVLDHHDTPGDLRGVPFVDIRHDLGATCTLVTDYLLEQGVDVEPRLATALFYGIETETCGFPREAGAEDDRALHFLYPKVDKELLSRIRNARLPQSHFGCMLRALQSSFIYGQLIFSWIDELPQPELAAEVVDFLIRFEEVDYAVAAGVWEGRLILSARAAREGAKCGDLLRKAVGDMGRAGGHDRRAGGTIPVLGLSPSAIDDVRCELRRRLLRALKIDECRGQRLMPRREMIQNIQA